MELITNVIRLGGTARTAELLQLGHGSHALTAAVRSGDLVRIRKGHYGLRDDAEAHQAYRVGGHLAGISALKALGVWVPRGAHPLEIAVRPNTSRLHRPTDAARPLRSGEALVHWDATTVQRSAPFAESAERAIRRVANRVSPAELFAMLESAMRLGAIGARRAVALRLDLARTVDHRFAHAGRLSGSGAESLVVFWLLGLDVPFVQQARIDGVGHVDVLLGDRQIVEVDGERFHSGTEEFEADRRRQTVASMLGYRTLRVSARMVEREFSLVAAAIAATIDRGDHRAA